MTAAVEQIQPAGTSEGCRNPIVGGGGALVYPSIHSPNFLTGISGWTVKKDGSAEFDNLTIRGTFNGTDFILNNAGMFFYSSAPAAGNLIASIAAVNGTDGFGNIYFGGGFCAYSGNTAGSVYSLMKSGNLFMGLVSDAGAGSIGSINALTSPSQMQLASPAPFAVTDDIVLATGQYLFAATDSQGRTKETWHAMPLAAQWANAGAGFTQCQYRLVGSPPKLVEIIGTPTFTANGTTGLISGAAVSTALPAAYRPANLGGPVTMAITGGTGSTISAGKTPDIRVTTGGVVTVNGVTCAVTNGLTVNLFFHGFYSLDA
jgi:hypothetical protein